MVEESVVKYNSVRDNNNNLADSIPDKYIIASLQRQYDALLMKYTDFVNETRKRVYSKNRKIRSLRYEIYDLRRRINMSKCKQVK